MSEQKDLTEMEKDELIAEVRFLRETLKRLQSRNTNLRIKNKQLNERCKHTRDWVDE